MLPDVPSVALSTGARMPLLGFGTWGGTDEAPRVAAAVKTAIQTGFRSIDCAEVYKNEAAIGLALEELIGSKVVSRDELFITSKVWNTNHAKEHVRVVAHTSAGTARLPQPTRTCLAARWTGARGVQAHTRALAHRAT